MIDISNVETYGWSEAIRGMRNPKNSWDRIDSYMVYVKDRMGHDVPFGYQVGENDHKLMESLAQGGPVHAKYRRMITVYLDILAPLYWWKEFDTYKVGTVANSCSTMHKIHSRVLTLDDFSHEHLYSEELDILEMIIRQINGARALYLDSNNKEDWWQMIQLLPSSYNQLRTVMLNYEVLANIYQHRKDHKLDEWHTFCDWIKLLPNSELITGKEFVGFDEEVINDG